MRIFKSKLFILALVSLMIFIIIGVSSEENSRINRLGSVFNIVFSPFQKIFSFTGQKVEASLTFFNDIKTTRQENEELKAKIEQLEKENRELLEYKKKNKELREALNLKDQFNDYDSVGANIIAKDMGNWFNVFIIDRGSNDGIVDNLPVITGNGLVGRVNNTSRFSSKVIAIIDIDSIVFGRISKTRDLVRIKGDITLKHRGMCRMDYIPPEADIAVGDTIETSGLGGIFPKGIVIGKVKEVWQVSSELNRYAVIEPAVDFRRLEEVIVLKGKTGTGMGSAEK